MPSILFGDDDKVKDKYNGGARGAAYGAQRANAIPYGAFGGISGAGGQTQSDPVIPRGGGGTSAADIQSAYNDELIQARDAELAALEARLQSSIDMYNQQLNQIKANYEGLRDQSELDRYKSRRALREALANRGQLDSGYGRQEALNADLGYSSQLNAINLQEQQANQEIQNQINQLKADNLANKANIRAKYAEALRQ